MIPQAIEEETQHADGLVAEGWTWPMDTIAHIAHECETCAAIKQDKWLKHLWYGGQRLKYKYGEAQQTALIMLPQTHQDKSHVLRMVEVPMSLGLFVLLVFFLHSPPHPTESWG